MTRCASSQPKSALDAGREDVDGRVKPGHDDWVRAAPRYVPYSATNPSLPASAEDLQRAFQQQFPGGVALDLAAGGLRQCGRRYQRNGLDRNLVLSRDRFANASGNLIKIQVPPLRPLDLLHHRKFLVPILVRDRERRAAVPA